MFPEAYLVDDLFAVIVIGIVRFPVICSPLCCFGLPERVNKVLFA